MLLHSPAKINLHLRIGPNGPDGFHPLMSWFCTVGLFDELNIQPRPERGIDLTCDRPEIPIDENNLIVHAGNALAPMLGARVRLKKNIPVGGGLGGGSSNAATALIGFNNIWNLRFPIDHLAAIGAKLGSDVPFFFYGPSSVCTGRGESVKPIDRPKPAWAVLFFPNLSMPTPSVYRRFDEMNLGSESAIDDQPDWHQWTGLCASALLPLLLNDLEAPAFSLEPELGRLRSDLEKRIGRIVRMSGSGSTLFTLCDQHDEAERIARDVQDVSAHAIELAPINPA